LTVNRHWFTQRQYGYGATPASWEGWTLIFVLVGAVVVLGFAAAALGNGVNPLGSAFLAVLALAVIVGGVVISHRKTEGGWRWRWGNGH
jgi:hypothetical protein